MLSPIERVNAALRDLKNGKMIVLVDDADRENEGDLIMPADKITPDAMNFMIRQGTGIVCLALTETHLAKLNLPLMLASNENTCARGTQFTISVDAKAGITTGVSAFDRTVTIKAMMNEAVTPDDLVKPGHIFPLQAKADGVLERRGHTEGAVDLAKLAGLQPASVLCEIMNPDGTMARGQALQQFAKTHGLMMLSINDIMIYRLRYENRIVSEAKAELPLENYGMFNISVVKEKLTQQEHLILFKEKILVDQPLLVRIHSSCVTGDLFSSKRCDCNKQLHFALQKMSEQGGMLIYLNQEGRGIGLLNKIHAYALQETGLDTVEANQELGLPIDGRRYHIAANILRHYQVDHIRLLTNNPYKIADLLQYGITTVERVIMPVFSNEHNAHYLKTKQNKLNHLMAHPTFNERLPL